MRKKKQFSLFILFEQLQLQLSKNKKKDFFFFLDENFNNKLCQGERVKKKREKFEFLTNCF